MLLGWAALGAGAPILKPPKAEDSFRCTNVFSGDAASTGASSSI